jgi:predicted site-specific integrase-resolvase
MKITKQEVKPMPAYMNEKQAAERYSIAIQTLRNWRSVGKGPPYVKLKSGMRLVRYPIDTTEKYFQSHMVDPEANNR